ncbi:hypothetical protein BKK52_03245 [Rodentibacter trehalosifermentans]|uniref:Uncharacterized protein n=1 Tax=Rodentibacter trehalosifermentans TaxID=1908263 RepID=A0A1V3J3N6_9PAST|nr:hypothetical protein [Rodentibacter trehalosifermentans]OOF49542.1 hypothetical protein BKK52_03245 [Rodentibacter trehalosifermentans]
MQKLNVQYLFIAACVLKLGALIAAFFLKDIYIFGFILPLIFMAIYIILGWKLRENEVSDEKFADSCYYLGFIFTIATILLILIDLDSIGHDINTIAARFAIAMVTTLFGVIARVYIIGFKKDAMDKMDDAEAKLLLATERMTEQMEIASDRFSRLANEISLNSENCRNQLEGAMEGIGNSYAKQAKQFFDEIAKQYSVDTNNVVEANKKLALSIKGLLKNTDGLQQNLDLFAEMLNKQTELLSQSDLRPALRAIEDGYRQFAQNVSHQTENQYILNDSIKQLQGTMGNQQQHFLQLNKEMQAVQDRLASLTQAIPTLSSSVQQLSHTAEKQRDYKAELTQIAQLLNTLVSQKPAENINYQSEIDEIRISLMQILELIKLKQTSQKPAENINYQSALDEIQRSLMTMSDEIKKASTKRGIWGGLFRSGEERVKGE